VPAEQRELVGEERDVEERDDRLGDREGQWPQSRALTPRQDDRGYWPAQGSASLISITGMPSRIG